jgi:hypothetical protein
MQKIINDITYVDAKKAASLIGVSIATFRQWQAKGVNVDKLDPKPIGTRTFYAVGSVRKFAKNYVPFSRVTPQPQETQPKITSGDINATLTLILEVLTQLQKTIQELKGTLH